MENKRLKEKSTNVVSFVPNGDYYYNKALKAIDRDEMDKAYKYIKRAADLSQDDAHVLLQYGILEMELQNFDHAYELIHTAYSIEPNEAEIVFMLAEVSGCIGHIADAQKYAAKYLEMDPNGTYIEDATEILDFFDYVSESEAIEDMDEYDGEKLVAQEKARRLMEQGNFQSAIEVLEQTIEEFPDLWNAYNNLALAYFYIGEAEQARALLYKVLRENQGNLHALCNLAVFAYYEKNNEELGNLLELLNKIQPYDWDNRYKLGATFALIGEYESAYKWLRSMSKRGYEGDAGFYFWLAQSAHFTGHKQRANEAWQTLIKIDPTKEGMEPWLHGEVGRMGNSAENHRDFIIRQLSDEHESSRLFGLFLLKRSAHRQEIVAHPTLLNVTSFSELEKLSLAYALEYEFNQACKEEQTFLSFMQVAELIVQTNEAINLEVAQILSTWFALGEIAFKQGYAFKNSAALAASIEYSFHVAIENKVTKKEMAEKYGISTSTLTKYNDELYNFVPTDYE
ncbi:tetratricopeptide repeat protein [Solibacillus sp. MA9]|uniref:Tetratricopeptide repeat protein n=1 Tax=Solibacillus palustris TaxID=2908203 RepID=A0ABS9UET3_9BACL|nr:tetratricopeptide repeat protein [Solibacillus sp. MA9]MCH7322863.1 tetratricopeptide repeat protein [Solibacillus sp. MA9]